MFDFHAFACDFLVVGFAGGFLFIAQFLDVNLMTYWQQAILVLFLNASVTAVAKHKNVRIDSQRFLKNRSVMGVSVEHIGANYQLCSSVYYNLKFYCVPFFLPE